MQNSIPIIITVLISLFTLYKKLYEFLSLLDLSKKKLDKYLFLKKIIKEKELQEFVDYEIKKWSFYHAIGLSYCDKNIKIIELYNTKLRDEFSTIQIKSIAPFVYQSEEKFLINLKEVKKQTMPKIVFYGCIFLFLFIFFMYLLISVPTEINSFFLYIFIIFSLFIFEIIALSNYHKYLNAKKFVKLIKSKNLIK
jgi:hypothetical protein